MWWIMRGEPFWREAADRRPVWRRTREQVNIMADIGLRGCR